MQSGGVFASIRDDREVFEAVAVEREFGTIEWPGGVDIDPDVLRGDHPPASGPSAPASRPACLSSPQSSMRAPPLREEGQSALRVAPRLLGALGVPRTGTRVTAHAEDAASAR